ncbi:hypothetical protein D5S17_20335 [Pseudonocardiaceae bacterium YIM PH 21723]|nr:hypothetical protein D5S17_20335 [Pseudonocardiaceae bacterium YIM PH 21723]
MSKARQVAGGGRAVEVEPERLAGWFDRFAERNEGVLRTEFGPDTVLLHAGNGTRATAEVPFGPFAVTGERDGLAIDEFLEHVSRSRTLGLLLVRLGGYSMGLARDGQVLSSSTDSKPVHGRNKAGGWSQQRFARRREGQARVALQSAADTAVRVLLPVLDTVDAVVLGGDHAALEVLREDRRLAPIFQLAQPRVLDVPEPRRSVLDQVAVRARSVEIVLHDRTP